MRLLDSCVWIDFLGGAVDARVKGWIVEGEAAICGTVLCEVLSGVRGEAKRARLAEALRPFPYLSETRVTYEAAAGIYAALRGRGVTIPQADCVLAALAREHDVTLVTHDQHFATFDEPERFVVMARIE